MAIEGIAEEIAENLEEAAQATRHINTQAVGFFLGGIGVGAVVGFYFGYKYNREKIRAEAYKESEAEVEKIRETYQQKTMVAQPKPSVEEVIEERGYSTVVVEEDRPLRPPVPVNPPHVVMRSPEYVWDYVHELEGRTPEEPYVIHQDEFHNSETGYQKVTYTYYAADDVLVAEDERPLPHGDVVVGIENLKFGHGTDDTDVVYVRNEHLELEMEICRSPKSYEEEVLGLDHDEAN